MNPTTSTSANFINPCSSMGQFDKLCRLNSISFGVIIGSAIEFILIIVTVVALFYLIWSGLRWITSGGDKAKVEGARGGIIAALIGLIIAFSAFFILPFALSFFGLNLTELTLPTLPNL